MSEDQDIFPEVFSSRFEKLEEPKKEDAERCIPFVSYLKSGKIHYKIMELNKEDKKSCLKQTDWYEDKIRNKITWEIVSKRLNRPLPDVKTAILKSGGNKKDNRLAFRKDMNIFFTKSLFTFGLRYTAPGECHIYETFKQPLLFFIPLYNMQRYPIGSVPFDPTSKASRNIPDDRCHTYILKKNSRYIIMEDTFYVMLTVQRSVFAVYKFRNQNVSPSDFRDFVGSLDVISMHSVNLSGKQLRKLEQNFENNSRTRKNISLINSDGASEDDSSQPAAKRFRSASGNHFGNPLLDLEMDLEESMSSNGEDDAENNRNVCLESHLTSNGHDLTIETSDPMDTTNLSSDVSYENLNPLPIENGSVIGNPSSDISINRPSCSSAIPRPEMNLEESVSSNNKDDAEDNRNVSLESHESHLTSNGHDMTIETNNPMNTSNLTSDVSSENLNPLPIGNGNGIENPSSDISINRPSCSSAIILEGNCDDLSAIQAEIINHSTPQKCVDQNEQSFSNTVDRGTSASLNCSISTQTETGNENETDVPETSDHEELSSHRTIQSSSVSNLPGTSEFTTLSNQNDSLIEKELAPFEMYDPSGNKFMYIPINLNWKESVSGPFQLHPFVKNVNGNAWAFVPIKTKDAFQPLCDSKVPLCELQDLTKH